MTNLHFTFRNLKATDAIKEHIRAKSKKIERYIDYPLEAYFFLKLENGFHVAELSLHAEHKELVAIASSKDLYNSIDMAINKVQSQLRKEREKRKGHQRAHRVARASLKKAPVETENL